MRKKSKELTILALMAVLMFAVTANCRLVVNAAEGDVEINETNFPDKAFRTYVSRNCDADEDGFLSEIEILSTEYMMLVGDDYTSLQGIEFFSSLCEMSAGGRRLNSLDVSKNGNLIKLYCWGGNLRNLVVNPGLQNLTCAGNDLRSLDLSKNTGLVELHCNSNRLSSLDLSNCSKLNQFYCSGNSLVLDFNDEGFEIEGLDVSRITGITGAKVVGTKIVPDEGSRKITYTYDVKNQNLENPTFTLIKSVHMEDVVIDEVNFPDGNFRSYVADYYDMDGNGKLSGDEVLSKTQMKLEQSNIASLKGIEHFFALESLNVFNNSLKSLDVSKNVELVSLDCSWNQLESLNVSGNVTLETLNCNNNCLNSLDVDGDVALTTLNCSVNDLNKLDVSKNVFLKMLDCGNNSLSSLDVSRNTMLESLCCCDNRLDKLDVGRNTGLKSLDCSSNNLNSLEVSENSKLVSLDCSGNNLDDLDVSNNTALEELYCSENRLKSLDLSNHAALMYLYCNNNKLSSLNLSQCLALEELECNGNELPVAFVAEGFTVEGLDVSRMSNLTGATIDIEGGLIVPNAGDSEITYTYDVKKNGVANPSFKLLTSVEDVEVNTTNFPDDSFRSYISSNCDTNKDGLLSKNEIDSTTSIDVPGIGVFSLKGIEFFSEMKYLSCSENNLDSLNLGKNTKLIYLDCSDNCLNELNVSLNTALTILNCDGNDIENLDLSKNIELTHLYCRDNSLSKLNVSLNTALTDLDCGGNDIENLDVSKNVKLTYLYCTGNNLNSLDVSKNTELTTLYCAWNGLSSLDISKNTDLIFLNCEWNRTITSLDISQNTALEHLNCAWNNLSSLDVSKNTALTELYCWHNKLDSLDVSKNTALTMLSCEMNKLSSLDVSKNTSLTSLYCSWNNLCNLDVGKCTKLDTLHCEGNEFTVMFVREGFSVEGLDITRINDLTGAVTVGNLIVPGVGVNEITYSYDVKNNGVANPTFKLVAAPHEHTFGTEWKSDGENHWHECVCGEKSDVHAHTPGAAATCTTAQTCTECGKVLKEATGHSFGKEWKSDGHSHWHECACGEKSDVAVHTPGEAADCDSAQTCSVCGRILEEAAGHTFGTEWKSDEETHWHECACGEKSDVAKHTPVTKVIPATFTKAGSLVTQCSVCEKVIKTENIPAIKTVELSQSIYVYDGKIKNSVLAIKDSKGKTIASKYYTVKKASGRKNVGSYTYKITFKGNYKGTKTLTFVINPKETKISSLIPLSKGFTIKWAKQDKQTTGYQFRYSLKTDMSNAKMVTVNKNTILTKTVKRLQANKKYYVQVRTYKTVAGKKYYSEWSKTGTVKTKK